MYIGGYQIVDFSKVTIMDSDVNNSNLNVGKEIVDKLKNTKKALYIDNLIIKSSVDQSSGVLSGYSTRIDTESWKYSSYSIDKFLIVIIDDEKIRINNYNLAD